MHSSNGHFDEEVAAWYDASSAWMFEPEVVEPAVDLLVELAGDGRALELGIGTGRIALPLSQRGIPVHGIELSKAMAAKLREKPGSEEIGVTIGDFATTRVDGSFTVAYLVFNTLANLGLISHHFRRVDDSWQRVSMPFRYAWPAELDLMAELAGMRLRDRWSGFDREPFTSESRKHVSVWEKAR